ncbi:MAG: hypothetical protein Q7R41_13565 [Phycisphaerales bacterium]|nr:hypothetical protein [Phycisphaerales bacterium]
MSFGEWGLRRRMVRWASASVVAGILPIGLIESCDQKVVEFTRYFDPCGTILANCAPGDFQVQAADVGDYCVDPACTVPGQCGGGQPLGTITRICP